MYGRPLKKEEMSLALCFLNYLLLEAFLTRLAKDCNGSRQKNIDKTVTVKHVYYCVIFDSRRLIFKYLSELS